MCEDYYLIGEKIVSYLSNNQVATGTLYDKVEGTLTPDDHYSHTFYALSAIKVYKKTGAKKWLKDAKRALDFYFSLPQSSKGHKEFNNFAILLIYLTLIDNKNDIKYLSVSEVERAVVEMTFNVNIEKSPSNNWLAIRACCHALRYYLFKSEYERKIGETLINHILRYQLEDGFFYDYPNIPNNKSYATPLTYHAKICSMLSMYNKYIHSNIVFKALTKGLYVLSKFIAPDGEAFYYGRTNNGIFGYVSAIYAYEQSAAQLMNVDDNKSRLFKESAKLFLGQCKKWQHEDGHISICPNREVKKRVGWDNYMHNTVYNAYSAALLLITDEI